MLNFDKDRFVRIQTGALSIAGEVRTLVHKLLSDRGGAAVLFMGTGGVQLLTLPAVELAQRHSLFPVSAPYPAQVVIDPPAGLDRRALVVIPSRSGTTKESVQLLPFLKQWGVRTISLTGHADTPLAQEADHNFTNFTEDDTSSESFYLQTLLIILALLRRARRIWRLRRHRRRTAAPAAAARRRQGGIREHGGQACRNDQG